MLATLALVMLLCLLPVWAMARTVDLSEYSEKDIQITVENNDIITGTLSAGSKVELTDSEDAGDIHLTLMNVTLQGDAILCLQTWYSENVTITLVGDNTLSSGGSYEGIGVRNGNLTIEGSGSLTATASTQNYSSISSDGISCSGNLKIQTTGDGFVKAIGGGSDSMEGNKRGIFANGIIDIQGKVIAQSGNNAYTSYPAVNGIFAEDGIIIRPGSYVEATGYKSAGMDVLSRSSITLNFNKWEDVLVKAGANKDSATPLELKRPNNPAASSFNLDFNPITHQYVLITTEEVVPAAPVAPASGSVPKTGDESNVILWSALAAMSIAGMTILIRKKKAA